MSPSKRRSVELLACTALVGAVACGSTPTPKPSLQPPTLILASVDVARWLNGEYTYTLQFDIQNPTAQALTARFVDLQLTGPGGETYTAAADGGAHDLNLPPNGRITGATGFTDHDASHLYAESWSLQIVYVYQVEGSGGVLTRGGRILHGAQDPVLRGFTVTRPWRRWVRR